MVKVDLDFRAIKSCSFEYRGVGTLVDKETKVAEDGGLARFIDEAERLLERGDVTAAEAKFAEAVRLQPDSAYLHNKLGVCYARQGRLEEARARFRHALTIDPTFAPAHSNMGNIHREGGRLDDAITSYLEALRHDPDYYIAHHNLGAAYRQQGRINEAVSHLKRANRLEKQAFRLQARQQGTGQWAGLLLWIALGAFLLFLFFR